MVIPPQSPGFLIIVGKNNGFCSSSFEHQFLPPFRTTKLVPTLDLAVKTAPGSMVKVIPSATFTIPSNV